MRRELFVVVLTFLGIFHDLGAQSSHTEPSTLVIVVRHAEKDTSPENDPHLTAAGVARAAALAEAIANAHVQAIITTQLLRSRETARPAAEANKVVPEVIARTSATISDVRAVAHAVRRHAGQAVLVLGHGETVGPILQALGAPRIPTLCASDYSELFILVLKGPTARLIRSSYGAPSVSPPDCSNLRHE
ncbi:MAG: histidine phosphatase family protein [Gemmatimonadaceae bacterium]